MPPTLGVTGRRSHFDGGFDGSRRRTVTTTEELARIALEAWLREQPMLAPDGQALKWADGRPVALDVLQVLAALKLAAPATRATLTIMPDGRALLGGPVVSDAHREGVARAVEAWLAKPPGHPLVLPWPIDVDDRRAGR
jgi:hypothetical protein